MVKGIMKMRIVMTMMTTTTKIAVYFLYSTSMEAINCTAWTFMMITMMMTTMMTMMMTMMMKIMTKMMTMMMMTISCTPFNGGQLAARHGHRGFVIYVHACSSSTSLSNHKRLKVSRFWGSLKNVNSENNHEHELSKPNQKIGH